MEEEELLVLVAEKKAIWSWEETHDNAGAGPFQCTRANSNRLLNCCKLVRPTVLLYLKRQTLIILGHFCKKVIQTREITAAVHLQPVVHSSFPCESTVCYLSRAVGSSRGRVSGPNL